MKTKLFIGWTTIDSKAAAESLARGIVEQRLATCVQIDGPVQSIYQWQGSLQSEQEWRLMIKFTVKQQDSLEMFIKGNHPYDVPEWVSVQVDRVMHDYLTWTTESDA